MIGRIRKGQIIEAGYLNEISGGLNELIKLSVDPPLQINKPASPDQQNADPGSEPLSAYLEISRSISSVQVFDQNDENYAKIDRIESVSFKNGSGDVIQLVFNN